MGGDGAVLGMQVRKDGFGTGDRLEMALVTAEADAQASSTLCRPVQEQSPATVPGGLVQPEVPGHSLHFWG